MKIVAFGQAIIHETIAWPAQMLALTHDADVVVCNFEGCLPPVDAWPMKTKTTHQAHPNSLNMLKELGVTHITIANNHAWDFGLSGLMSTREKAEALGFAVAGGGVTLEAAAAPACQHGVALIGVDAGPTPEWAIASETPGVNPLRLHQSLQLPEADISRLQEIMRVTGELELRIKRAEIGYDNTPVGADFFGQKFERADEIGVKWDVDADDFARLVRSIENARLMCDVVLVAIHYHHWGHDWSGPPCWLTPLCERLVDAGANGVLCTGPPFYYETTLYKDAAIAPSLGNLVFHTKRGPAYDRLNLPVWEGGVLVFENNKWTSGTLPALGPD